MPTENEKQLTAMSELISELQNIRKRYIGDSGVHDGARMALDKAIEIAKSKLATERQQLIDAYDKGFENGKDLKDPNGYNYGEIHYNKTFKTQK